MDLPRIQYTKTSDGVNIAYWTMGEGGIPLVVMPDQISHIQLEFEFDELRTWYQRLAQRGTLVRYDGRGSGLSDREAPDFGLDALALDLDAVVASAGLERFALFAQNDLGPAGITYAVRHPERVSHLILWSTYARGADAYSSPEAQSWSALRDKDWKTYTETVAHVIFGWSASERARQFAAFMREATTREAVLAFTAPLAQFDVTGLLSAVRAPTLVAHRRRAVFPRMDLVKELAAEIPGARLVMLEASQGPFGDSEQLSDIIAEFLTEPEAAGVSLPSGMTAILFADIVDSTGLTERLGDAAFRAKARDLDTALRGVIREHAGTPIEGKLLGDGVLAVFTSARQAIEAALACGRSGDGAGLPLHLGLHAGDVIREENNVYGGAVNIASRISGLSAPGEVLVSETVRSLARTSAGVRFEDRGEQSLKGVGEPVRVWAVCPSTGSGGAEE
jgi:class 3 adenylate cyclase